MKRTGLYKNVKSWAFGLVGLCALVGGQAAMAQKYGVIYYDYIDANGVLKGGIIEVDPTNPKHTVVKGAMAAALPEGAVVGVETIIDNGPTWNRVDLAILGDGYTEEELDDYATDVANLVAGFFAESPFDEYGSFFNVHRVDVKSNQSGVGQLPEGDCPAGDTALLMCFGGAGNRVLYINVWNAIEAANHEDVPDWDHILALANTDRYGGTGYFDDKITTAPGHEEEGWTNDIALHEFGHALINLGDEYWTEDWDYMGGEPAQANLSTYDYDQMKIESAKWYRWLDAETVPTEHGPIDTYEGGGELYATGIYRPTNWSKMRRVDHPFHQVNVEQFIFEIYKIVEAVDYATPEGTYALGTQFFVEPLQPATHSLDVTWYRVGDPDPVGTGTEFDSSTLDLATGEYTLRVKVVDKTEMVKDEGKRESDMTWERTWTLLFNDSSHLNDTSKFYVKNASGENVAWFGNLGNIVLRGRFTSGEVIDTAPPSSFIIKDSTDDTVAYIDNEGNLCIEGSKLSGNCDPPGDAFIIRNSSDANVSYIDFANGDLCLIGELIDYSNP